MGHDPFFDHIIQGLKSELDPDLFEDCAIDLLKDDFPGIAPIPGGSDAGRDGAIPDGEGEAFPLVCTTGQDVIGNLTRSLRSYLKESGTRRKVVLATSNFLTEKRKQNLEKRARDLGFTLVQIIDGQGIAHRLYRRPEWCKRLLGLTGHPSALSVFPPSTRPLLEQTIIGREEDIAWLEGRSIDSIVIGQPGSGKTFLLYTLCKKGWGLFLVDDDIGRIADAVRSQKPAFIIVDDAQVKQDLIGRLLQLRKEIHADFIIVATCWPGGTDEIMSLMNCTRQDTRVLDLLNRDTMVKIVAEAGIIGPNILVREIVTQAQGKPGLAVTLVDLCMKGDVREVIFGGALSRYVRQFFEKIEGKGIADILAAFSLGGDGGISYEVIADYFKIPLIELRRKLVTLHAGGIIQEMGNGRISVQPSVLRYSLIKDAFFEGPCPLPYRDFLDHALINEISLSLIGARSAGAKIPDHEIKALLSQTQRTEVWKSFAELGPQEALYVLKERPALIIDIASVALHHNPQISIELLLKKAVHDLRNISSNPDHALRKIHDWIKRSFNDEQEAIQRRKLLLKIVTRWFADGCDSAVGIQALTFLFLPFLEKMESDPGQGRTFTMYTKYLSIQSIAQLKEIWKEAYEILKKASITGWDHLFSMLHALVYPYLPRISIPKEVYEAYRELARVMVIDLSVLAQGHPGVITRLSELCDNLSLSIPIYTDKIYSTLYPREKKRVDFHKHFDALVKTAEDLALAMKDHTPEYVVEEIHRVEKEAERANITWPRMTHFFCNMLAQHTKEPSKWIELLIAHDCKADLIEPFLLRCIALHDEQYVSLISRCLGMRQYCSTALCVVLEHTFESEEVLQKALDTIPEYTESVKLLVYRRLLSNDTLKLLLSHPDARVAETVAIGMWEADPEGSIDESLYEHWRKAFLRSEKDEYWIGRIVLSDIHLCFDWLSARLKKQKERFVFDDDEIIGKAADLLSPEQRMSLINEIKDDIVVEDHLIGCIVGNDVDAYREVLSQERLKRYHLIPLHGYPTPEWIEKAKVARESGYTPDGIANAAIGSYWFWKGRVSDMWKLWMDYAKKIIESDDENIQAIGKAMLDHAQGEYEQALAEERREDVYGGY